MPIDPEKLTKYVGIEVDSNEAFEAEFAKKFIPADQKAWDEETKGKIFGRTIGSIGTGVKQIFDENEISLTGDDLKQPPEAIVKLGLSKLREKYESEKAELQKTAGLTADEKIREATETIQKQAAKIKDYEGLVKAKAAEFENLTKTNAAKLKEFKLNSTSRDIETSISWNPDKDEFSRKGFLTTMKERYAVDLDENDEEFIVNRQTGERIKAEGSHSTFMKPKEVYAMEALKAGMASVNKNAGKTPVATAKPATTTTTTSGLPASAPITTGKKVMANTRYQPKV